MLIISYKNHASDSLIMVKFMGKILNFGGFGGCHVLSSNICAAINVMAGKHAL